MTIIKKTINNKCWQDTGKKNSCVLLIEVQDSTTTMEIIVEIYQNTKN
jgi:hypothetical protein